MCASSSAASCTTSGSHEDMLEEAQRANEGVDMEQKPTCL